MKKAGFEVFTDYCAYVAIALLAAGMFVQVGIHHGREVEQDEIVAANRHCVLKLK